jgi:hypothetical protein
VYEFIKEFYGGAENIRFPRTDCNNKIGRECNKYLGLVWMGETFLILS